MRVAHERRQAVYLEAFGKGGLWGVGWDMELGRRLGVGAAASFAILDGERILSFSPYLSAYPFGARGRHRWFAQLGPQVVHVSTPSPVPEWPGTSSTGFGAELSSGYEYRNKILVRLFGMATLGEGGFAPWFGVSLGWTF